MESILLGLAASVVFAVLTLLFNKFLYYKLTYGKIAGKYDGFGYKDDNNTECDGEKWNRLGRKDGLNG